MEAQALSSEESAISQLVASDKAAQAQLQVSLQQQGDSAAQVASSESKLEAKQQQGMQQLIQQQEQKQAQLQSSVTSAEEKAGLLAPAPAPAASTEYHTASSKQFLGQLGGNKGQLTHLRSQEKLQIQAQVTQEVTELDAAQNSALAQFVATQTQQEENA